MKIFMSHSSRQKLFVKELKKYIPHQVSFWIDEKETLMGENITASIENAITNECDFFILVIDEYSVKSKWVLEEIKYALAKEEQLNRVFFLPIVLDKNAWSELENETIKSKKYIYCNDFTDSNIEAVSKELTSELFTWLCKEFENKNHHNENSSLILIHNADKISKEIAEEIKTTIHPYRKTNPLDLNKLGKHLKEQGLIKHESNTELLTIIERLVELNFLNGIDYDNNVIYLSQERFNTKSSLYNNSKKAIAKKAFSYINPGQIIALDGGSTTLELTRLICKNLKLRNLFNLKIITNSIPNAYELLTTLGELGVNDHSAICDVYLIGGHARPVSFTIVPEDKHLGVILENDLQYLFDKIGNADICFVGTNGISKNYNFANHNKYEVKAKMEMIKNSNLKFILADASKFQVQQESEFASLSQGLKIITSYDHKFETSINKFQDYVNQTPSEIIFA